MIKKQMEKIIRWALRQRFGMVKGDLVFSLLNGQVGEFLERLDDEQSKKAAAWITKQLGDKKDLVLLLLK
jgi:hypothetical protein